MINTPKPDQLTRSEETVDVDPYLESPHQPPQGDLGLPKEEDYGSEYPWRDNSSYPSIGDSLEAGAAFKSGEALASGISIATKDTVITALREVYDPEIPVNIYDLGLIYQVDISEVGDVDIVMTLTTPNCPVAGILPQTVADQAASCEGIGQVQVNLTWEPPWDTSQMSEDAKIALGFID